jgi:hypothetical protein
VAACKAPQKGVAMNKPQVVLCKLAIGLAVTAAGALSPPAAAGTTYYVNGSCGNNNWTGTSPVCAAPNGPKATIQAGIDATASGDEVIVADGVYTGAGNRDLDFDGRLISLRSAGGPDNCVIDCQENGRGFYLHSGETLETVIQGFTITNGSGYKGGAILLDDGDATLIDCVFTNNTAEIGSALHQARHAIPGNLVLSGCTFSGNTALVGGGAVFSVDPFDPTGSFLAVDCVFTDNDGGEGPGAVGTSHVNTTFVNCVVARNVADSLAGGIAEGSAQSTMINCVLSRNEAPIGGGVVFGDPGAGQLLNCTIAGNVAGGIGGESDNLAVDNCILWGNTEWQIEYPTDAVTYSDVQGGWPGEGNIDADPLFVQPGTDNVRLSIGSPCGNAGINAALPPDEFDLDGDGDTSEPLPLDLDHNPRLQGGTVDMGAYEGESDEEPPGAAEGDLDNGEFAILIPTGGGLDPLEAAAVIIVNESGPDDATVVVTEYEADLHPGAGGYSELSCILDLETSLADGQHLTTMFIPFDATGFGQIDPGQVDLTRYDPVDGNWALAVTGNTADSPGHDGPVGDRVMSLEGGPWNLSNELGDYGVYWDPAVGQGFAWANVDVAQHFGLGVPFCPTDCLQPPDGEVSVLDFLAMLATWGDVPVGGPCDVDSDGVVGMADFQALLNDWGPCPVAARPPVPGGGGSSDRPGPVLERADVDGNAVVDRADLAVLRASWGPCDGDCRADLDGDGVVGVRDLLALLAAWPSQ